jgi:hypothetical protein
LIRSQSRCYTRLGSRTVWCYVDGEQCAVLCISFLRKQAAGRVADKKEAATCAPDRRSASGYYTGRCALRKAETVEERTELQKGDALTLATPPAVPALGGRHSEEAKEDIEMSSAGRAPPRCVWQVSRSCVDGPDATPSNLAWCCVAIYHSALRYQSSQVRKLQ